MRNQILHKSRKELSGTLCWKFDGTENFYLLEKSELVVGLTYYIVKMFEEKQSSDPEIYICNYKLMLIFYPVIRWPFSLLEVIIWKVCLIVLLIQGWEIKSWWPWQKMCGLHFTRSRGNCTRSSSLPLVWSSNTETIVSALLNFIFVKQDRKERICVVDKPVFWPSYLLCHSAS